MNLVLKSYLWCCGSGNIGENGLALMEAVHGTAPDIAGKVDNSTHSFDTCFVECLTYTPSQKMVLLLLNTLRSS